jgi:SAM-dependent methyltransferase
VWATKPTLRRIYRRWWLAMRREALAGRTLEVGGGGGHLKEFWPDVLSSDVVDAPWLDLQADCLALPFRDGTFDNVVGVDVLHHLFHPDLALREIARVMRPGGRAIFVEPYVSRWSGLVRGRFHHERQDLERDVIYDATKRPEEANLAIPTRLFVRHGAQFASRFPGLRIRRLSLSDVLAYPLTRGFGAPNLLPEPLLGLLHRLEPALAPLHRWLAFKMLVVLERVAAREAVPG